jgi:hypothetical protein
MTRTIDIVIVGANAAAIAATVDAAGRGLRVLLVIRPRLAALSLEHRQTLRRIRVSSRGQVSVVAGTEVACVDGVRAIEAVVVRHVRTGRLRGFNASALLDFGERGRSTALRLLS